MRLASPGGFNETIRREGIDMRPVIGLIRVLAAAMLILPFGSAYAQTDEQYSYDDDIYLDFIWDPATGPVHHYNVFVSIDGGEYQLVGTTETTSYRLIGEDGHVYRVKVQAVDAEGNTGPMSDESDPVIVALPVQLQLEEGFNLVGIPFYASASLTSHQLIREKGCKLVAYWDVSRGRWISTFAVGDEILGPDFELKPGMGVFIKVDRPITLTFKGRPPFRPQLQLRGGFNLVSIPKSRRIALSAHDFLRRTGASQISWWDPARGRWVTALRVGNDILGPDFELRPGYGYFVKAVADETVDLSVPAAPRLRIGADVPALQAAEPELKSLPHPIYGVVLMPDGLTPAAGATVTVTLIRGWRRIAEIEVKADERGIWHVDLPAEHREGDLIKATARAIGLQGEYPAITVEGMGAQFLGALTLEMRVPTETKLLANYPNPFNPETWIPFQLAKEADVTIKIFDMSGRLVRTLRLGRLKPGYYVDKSRAAYWDGRNELGERVASGVYFCVLEAGKFRAVRRMVVSK